MMKKLKLFSLALMALFATSVWAKTWNVDLTGSGVSTDGITLTGAYIANAQVGSNSQKANSLQAKTSSVCVFSENTNITGISFKVCRATNGNSATKAVSIYTAKGGVYSLPAENTFAATNNSSSITSLYQITAVGNNQANANSVSVTFNSPVKAIELRYEDSNGANIHEISIIYNEATTPTTLLNAVIAGSTPAATVTPDGAAITLSVNSSSPKTIGSNKFYQWNSGNTLDLGTGKKFKVGDQIIADVCASGDKKGVGFKLDGGDTDYIVYLNASVNAEVCYTVTKDDGVEGQQTVTLKRKGSDTYVHSFRVLRPVTYTVTYKANGGTGDDIEDESATAVAANSFTYEGYRFMGWNTDAEGNGTAYAVNANVTDNLTLYAQWSQEYSVSYANTGAASGSAPTNDNKYIKDETFEVAGVGTMVAATGKTFRSWSDGVNTYVEGDTYTIGTSNVSFTPIWVDVYDVTFDKGAATGTAPAAFQKWEGAKFNLPGQGEMVAPDGKVFDGWKAGETKYTAGEEYTMTASDVEFVAQWRNAPTTIFYYQWSGSSTAPTANSALTATGGTFTFYKSSSSTKDFQTADVTYNANVPSDMKTVAETSDKLVALNSTTHNSYLITLTGDKYFAEGDTVYVAGYGSFKVGTTHGSDNIVAGNSALVTGTGASDVKVGYFIFPAVENVNTLYITRNADSGNRGFTAVKVVRPNKYSVNFAAGAGSGTMSSLQYIEGSEVTLPACTFTNPTGYEFDEWTSTDASIAAGKLTMPSTDVTVTATFAAITYDITIEKGSNASTAGTATVDYDATSLNVTSATTGTGTLLGYYTAASDGTKVANADGSLVEGTVDGYVTSGKWSRTSAATLYAVYNGEATALDNTAEEVKAVKRIENGMLIIEKDGKTYNVLGTVVK